MGGWGGWMIGLATAMVPPMGGWGGWMIGLATAMVPPMGGWGGWMIGLATAMVPPMGGWGGWIIGLATATLAPLVFGSGMRSAGLASAKAIAETLENTRSAAKRKAEKDVIWMFSCR
jgi:hypothetical protein